MVYNSKKASESHQISKNKYTIHEVYDNGPLACRTTISLSTETVFNATSQMLLVDLRKYSTISLQWSLITIPENLPFHFRLPADGLRDSLLGHGNSFHPLRRSVQIQMKFTTDAKRRKKRGKISALRTILQLYYKQLEWCHTFAHREEFGSSNNLHTLLAKIFHFDLDSAHASSPT